MFAVDLHTHTRFFHGFEGRPTRFDPIGAELLARSARWRGLDGVAVTNHDYYSDFDAETAAFRMIPGVEVSTTAGHALVVGPDPPSRTVPGELTPEEVVTLAHDEACAAIIAHPYRRSSIHEREACFDAVEINGKHPQEIDRVRKLAGRLDLPVVGGSDAHFPFEVGRAFTSVESAYLTPESVAAAIREGRVEPHIRNSYPNRLVRKWYRFVHKYIR
jgi:predicted metal-dependent phosphoesterase TrpH